MKMSILKTAAFFALFVAALVLCLELTARAQEKKTAPAPATNWIGYLVIGKEETGDPIAGRGPYPKADSQIQIGLRSDGVLVWRRTPPPSR